MFVNKLLSDKKGRCIRVHKLSDVPFLIQSLSVLLYNEFKRFEQSIQSLDEYYKQTTIRARDTIVITDEKSELLLGSGSLVQHDIMYGKYSECSPWIADIFVLEHERGRGLASLIIDELIDKAFQAHGIDCVYLWTEHQELYSFYQRKGFVLLEEREYMGTTIGVFKITK